MGQRCEDDKDFAISGSVLVVYAGAAGTSSCLAPHFVQNRIPGESGAPQRMQKLTAGVTGSAAMSSSTVGIARSSGSANSAASSSSGSAGSWKSVFSSPAARRASRNSAAESNRSCGRKAQARRMGPASSGLPEAGYGNASPARRRDSAVPSPSAPKGNRRPLRHQ